MSVGDVFKSKGHTYRDTAKGTIMTKLRTGERWLIYENKERKPVSRKMSNLKKANHR